MSYNMAKLKTTTRAKSTKKRARAIPGHVKISLPFPKVTLERLEEHCRESGMHVNDFIRAVVYDKLPVKYKVTPEFVFPFGKFQGETAKAVLAMQPDYIGWCKQNIVGFDASKLPAPASSSEPAGMLAPIPGEYPHSIRASRDEVFADFSKHLKFSECLLLNATTKKAWAYRLTPWGQKKNWRFLGTYAIVP